MATMSELPTLDLEVTPGGLAGLARCFGIEGSSMVPFPGAGAEGAGPSVEDMEQLRGAGLLDGQNRVDAKVGAALQAVVGSSAYGRVQFGLVRPELDAVVFHTVSGPVSLVARGDKVRLCTRPGVEDLSRAVGQLTGISVLRAIGLDVSVSLAAGACLVAALDACRRSLLKALLDGADPAPPPVTSQWVLNWLAQPAARAQWLTPRFLAGRDRASIAAPAAVEAGFAELAGGGLLAAGGGGFVCGDALMEIAARLVTLDTAAMLAAGRGSAGKLAGATTIGAVRGGANAILIWEDGPNGTVHFMGLSPAGLLAIAADFLGNPEALPAPAATPRPAPAAAPVAGGPKFCAQCGNAVVAGDRFCRGCGKPIG